MTKEILHRLGLPVLGTKVAVQGMGNVGGTTAKLLYNEGCKIIAVSDVSGCGILLRMGTEYPITYMGRGGNKPYT